MTWSRLIDERRPAAAWWEDEGRRIGATLDGCSAAVVLAADPEDAAAVALGIGEVQARRRRVVVADLSGELATIQRLLTSEDAHGLSDSFLYGVSLNKIAQRVGDGENLFLLPGGTEPVLTEEIYRHDRWRRLIAGFREVGALLLLVAPASAPALDALAAHTDGAILAGKATVPASGVTVIDTARAPLAERPQAAAVRRVIPPGMRNAAPSRSRRQGIVGSVTAGTLLVAVAAFVLLRTPADEPRGVPVNSPDSAAPARRLAIDSAGASVATEMPMLSNAGDSALAAGYAVEIAKFSTSLGALLRVRDELPPSVPARTFAMVPIGGDRALWYRVVAGASVDRAGGDSLLMALRRTGVIDDSTAGAVVRVPLAFVLQRGVAPQSAASLVTQFQARGVPAYALRQSDATVTLYAGAFESAEQASLLISSLRAAGIEPALVYRLGRTF